MSKRGGRAAKENPIGSSQQDNCLRFLSRVRLPGQILRIKSRILVSDHLLKPRIRIGGAYIGNRSDRNGWAGTLSPELFESGQETALEKLVASGRLSKIT